MPPTAVELLGAQRVMLLCPVSPGFAVGEVVGQRTCRIGCTAIVAAQAVERFQHIAILDGQEVTFGFAVDRGNAGRGVVLVEPLRGARLYDQAELGQLSFLFQLIGPGLMANAAVASDDASLTSDDAVSSCPTSS